MLPLRMENVRFIVDGRANEFFSVSIILSTRPTAFSPSTQFDFRVFYSEDLPCNCIFTFLEVDLYCTSKAGYSAITSHTLMIRIGWSHHFAQMAIRHYNLYKICFVKSRTIPLSIQGFFLLFSRAANDNFTTPFIFFSRKNSPVRNYEIRYCIFHP